MEDYQGHVRLKQLRDSAFEIYREAEEWRVYDSTLLKQIFRDIDHLRDSCQTLQADAVRLHTEAIDLIPPWAATTTFRYSTRMPVSWMGSSTSGETIGRKLFMWMQEVNQPLLLVVRCRPTNVPPGRG